MISQHWFRWWLGAIRQQAITWASVDLDPCRHMTSLGHNELNFSVLRINHSRRTYYTHRNEVSGGILDSACLSVCPSVRLSVCPLTFRVRPVASTVPDGFFPYLVQMITSMRRCVPCDDLWPWPISSRSFDLDLENRVRSVASTVLDGFLLYL